WRDAVRVLFARWFDDEALGKEHGLSRGTAFMEGLRIWVDRQQRLGHVKASADVDGLTALIASVMVYLGVMSQIAWGEDLGEVRRLALGCCEAMAAGMLPR